jgi:hypothetical protein
MAVTHLDANDHVWKEEETQSSKENYTDVVCVCCGIHGELNDKTKEVFYPAT